MEHLQKHPSEWKEKKIRAKIHIETSKNKIK